MKKGTSQGGVSKKQATRVAIGKGNCASARVARTGEAMRALDPDTLGGSGAGRRHDAAQQTSVYLTGCRASVARENATYCYWIL